MRLRERLGERERKREREKERERERERARESQRRKVVDSVQFTLPFPFLIFSGLQVVSDKKKKYEPLLAEDVGEDKPSVNFDEKMPEDNKTKPY